MSIKIQPGTSDSLCATCREAQVVEFSNGVKAVRCHSRGAFPQVTINHPVTRCNDYDDRRQPAKWDMEKIAWQVTTDKSGKTIGFAPPKKDD